MNGGQEPAAESGAPPAPHSRFGREDTKWPSWIELSVALTALVVSIASLFVARHQAQVMDRQLAASVWPLLEYNSSNVRGDRPYISLRLRNTGVGPLRIRSFRVGYDGRPMRGSKDLLLSCCVAGDTTRPFTTTTSGVLGNVLPAGDGVAFLGLAPDSAQRAVYAVFDRERFRVAVRACYSSVLDDCWVVDTEAKTDDPQPVRSCAAERAQVQYRE